MNPLTLRALWQTGSLWPEQAPALAVGLLMDGADSPALRELAGMDAPTRAEAAPLVDRILSELGVPRLDAGVAWRLAAREIAGRAVRGTMAPYDAAHALYAICTDHGWPRELAVFIGLVDEWEYPLTTSGRAEIETEILNACAQLLVEIDDPSTAGPGAGGA